VSYDTATRRLQNRRIVVRNGARKDKPFSIRLYDAEEIRSLLNEAGLEVYKMLGADGQQLSPGSRRLEVVGRRPRAG
jgi:hypothetical protein